MGQKFSWWNRRGRNRSRIKGGGNYEGARESRYLFGRIQGRIISKGEFFVRIKIYPLSVEPVVIFVPELSFHFFINILFLSAVCLKKKNLLIMMLCYSVMLFLISMYWSQRIKDTMKFENYWKFISSSIV